jgi:hypothetical protein
MLGSSKYLNMVAQLGEDNHLATAMDLGVKTEQIQRDSSETVFVTIFFSDSEWSG